MHHAKPNGDDKDCCSAAGGKKNRKEHGTQATETFRNQIKTTGKYPSRYGFTDVLRKPTLRDLQAPHQINTERGFSYTDL